MELRQLEHFVAVAEELSITRAARRVGIVQSGLSSSIRALERELGVDLFVRQNRGVRLTPEGAAMLVEVRRALSALRSAVASAAPLDGSLSGEVALGITSVIPDSLSLPILLQQFHALHPRVRIRVRQGAPAALFEQLGEGTLDLVVAGAAPSLPQDVTTHVLLRSPMHLTCGDEHWCANESSVSIAQLATEPFVDVPNGWSSRMLVDEAFRQAGLARDVRFEVSEPAFLVQLVARHLGIAIVPAVLEQLWKTGACYVPIDPPLVEWQLVAGFVGARPANPAARVLVDMMVALSTAHAATARNGQGPAMTPAAPV